jgi:hypothetical protein
MWGFVLFVHVFFLAEPEEQNGKTMVYMDRLQLHLQKLISILLTQN